MQSMMSLIYGYYGYTCCKSVKTLEHYLEMVMAATILYLKRLVTGDSNEISGNYDYYKS